MQSGRSDDVRKEVLEVMGCRHTYYKRRGRKHGRRGHDTASLHECEETCGTGTEERNCGIGTEVSRVTRTRSITAQSDVKLVTDF